jgi:hypothetical protein
MVDERTSGDGIFANVGPIQMMQLQGAGPGPGPFPGPPAGGSSFPSPGVRLR